MNAEPEGDFLVVNENLKQSPFRRQVMAFAVKNKISYSVGNLARRGILYKIERHKEIYNIKCHPLWQYF